MRHQDCRDGLVRIKAYSIRVRWNRLGLQLHDVHIIIFVSAGENHVHKHLFGRLKQWLFIIGNIALGCGVLSPFPRNAYILTLKHEKLSATYCSSVRSFVFILLPRRPPPVAPTIQTPSRTSTNLFERTELFAHQLGTHDGNVYKVSHRTWARVCLISLLMVARLLPFLVKYTQLDKEERSLAA